MAGHTAGLHSLAYSPDGRTAVSVDVVGLHLWDLETGDEIQRIELSADGWEVAYTPDGKSALVTLMMEEGGEKKGHLKGEKEEGVEDYYCKMVRMSSSSSRVSIAMVLISI